MLKHFNKDKLINAISNLFNPRLEWMLISPTCNPCDENPMEIFLEDFEIAKHNNEIIRDTDKNILLSLKRNIIIPKISKHWADINGNISFRCHSCDDVGYVEYISKNRNLFLFKDDKLTFYPYNLPITTYAPCPFCKNGSILFESYTTYDITVDDIKEEMV